MEDTLPKTQYLSQLETAPSRKGAPFVQLLDRAIRRLLDILAAFFGLLVLSPVFLLIAIFIHRDTPGPIFYRGPRMGRNGMPFGILKFRTMYERPESYAGAHVTAQDDRRITPFGQWLRETKVNELPQLWNVLVGNMSLVGPRPEDPDYVADWPEDARAELLSVRPGITSPASIVYRDEEKMLSTHNLEDDYLIKILPTKLRLDQLYLRNRSILTDLDVIFWTAVVLLPQVRNRPIPNHLLYWGPTAQFFNRILNWFLIDFIISLLAIAGSGLAFRLMGPLNIGVLESIGLASGMALLFSLINSLLGLNRVAWSKAGSLAAMDLLFSSGLTMGILLIIDRVIFPPEMISMAMAITITVLSAAGFVAVRYRERLITGLANRWLDLRGQSTPLGERVMIVGAGDMGEFASWLFRRFEFSRIFTIVGMVDDDPRKVGMVVDGCKIMGTSEALPDLIRKNDIGLIVFAITRISSAQRERILSLCRKTPARLVLFPDLMTLVRSSLMPQEGCVGSDEQPTVYEEQLQRTMQQLEGSGLDAWIEHVDSLLENENVVAARALLGEMRVRFK